MQKNAKNTVSIENKFARVWRHKLLLLMFLPAFVTIILFNYIPMAGILLAFRDINTRTLPFGSEWISLGNFDFIMQQRFWTYFQNTVVIAGLKILFGFPAPILLAIMINEVRNKPFKRATQSLSYLPHFISWAIVANLLDRLLSTDVGLINGFIRAFGGIPTNFLAQVDWFLPLVVITHIWKTVGYSSIIYLAAISQINPELYEAAMVDGAGRIKRIRHITLPGMAPMISILLILTIPGIINAGFDQIYLMTNPFNQPVAEILDTYILRVGLSNGNYGIATAIGLFNSAIALLLLLISNHFSKRMGGATLW